MGLLTVKCWRDQMIIGDLLEPRKSLYVIGANILSAFNIADKKLIDPLELYEIFETYNGDISISYFYFGLDWLFVVNAVELDGFGNLKLCN